MDIGKVLGSIEKLIYILWLFFLGNLWETPGEKGVKAIVDRPPDCFWDLVKSPGVTTMHIYFKDYKTLCIFD